MTYGILLAEPDAALAGEVRTALEGEGYRVTTAANAGGALEALTRSHFFAVVLDAALIEAGEVPLIRFIATRAPQTRVVVTFSSSDAGGALRAGRQGAHLTLLKPYRPADLVAVLGQVRGAAEREERPPADDDTPFIYHGIVGKSAAMRRVIRLAAKVAPADTTVLISGETGTGKEMLARLIRRLSPRADGPFVTLNCGAIPDNLVESELFGHKKGAFTDAVADKKGLFEMAHGGTLLLDEVGELPPAAQAKLLRAIEDMEIRKVGDVNPVRVDVRVLASTNRDLVAEVGAGKFREDLWFRLNVVEVHIPPLRERREDVAVLLRYFLGEADRRFGRNVMGVAPEILPLFANHDFPGNVRELRNVVEHAVVMSDSDTIRMEDLPAHFIARGSRGRLLGSGAGTRADAPPGEFKFQTLAEAEKDLIRDTLERLKGNQTEAAKHLGISRSTLWRKMKEYELGGGLRPPSDGASATGN